MSNQMVEICKQCILKSTTPGVTLDQAGLCSECVRYNNHPGYNLQRLADEMEQRFAQARKQSRPYDVLVRFSGGKDSACLLHMLKYKYALRVLAFAVMHPFVKPIAAENMTRIAHKLNVDLIKFYPDEGMFKKFMRYGLLQGPKYGLREDVGCDLCGYVYHWVSHRIAIKMNIPYLVDGVDSSEHDKPIFMDGEAIKAAMASGVKYQGTLPDIFRDACGDEYRGSIYDQNFEDLQDKAFPTTMSPFTFLEYDYRRNLDELEAADVVTRRETRAVETNCDVRHLFAYIGFKRHDCHPWEKQFAIGLRKGYPTHIEQSGVDGAENLSRDDILKWLEEYKRGLYFVAENRDLSQKEKAGLQTSLPNMARTMGEEGFAAIVDQMFKIHEYAEYLGIDLQQL